MTEFKAKEMLDGVFETDMRLGFNDVTVTPGIAKKALELNYSGQRKLSTDIVSQRARDIARGSWRGIETATAIQVTPSGVLIDGQHTLSAVIMADMSVEMHVFIGGDIECFDVIDSGRPRTISGRLVGFKNGTTVASVGRKLVCLKEGASLVQAINGQIPRSSTGAKHVMHASQSECLDFCYEHKAKLESWCRIGKTVRSALGFGADSMYALFLALTEAEGNLDDALLFFDDMRETPPSSAAAFVTWRTMSNMLLGKHLSGRGSNTITLGILLKGFEAFEANREIKLIRHPEEVVSKYDVSALDFSRWEGEPGELAV